MRTALLLILSLMHLSLATAQETAASADDVFSITLGGPALIFALPAANQDVAKALTGKTIITLNELVGVMPAHPSTGVVVYFFQRNNGEEPLQILNALARRYRNDKIRVLAICIDEIDTTDLQEWIEPMKLEFPVLADSFRIVSERYDIRVTPTVVIIDRDGRVLSVGAPGLNDLNASLDMQVQGLLKSQQ